MLYPTVTELTRGTAHPESRHSQNVLVALSPGRDAVKRGRAPPSSSNAFAEASQLEGPDRIVVHNLKRESILQKVEDSLRLGGDAIYLYQSHWPIPDESIEEGRAAFAELRDMEANLTAGSG
jgi:aryl-alcohol dehydrogenase-like predicted oxidoreductase